MAYFSLLLMTAWPSARGMLLETLKTGLPLVVVSVLICCNLLVFELDAQGVEFEPGVQVGTVGSTAVNEASGIAASDRNSDVLWVHNDSGDSARVFAMNIDGTHLGIYSLSVPWPTDWEDMAVGPGPVPGESYLYLGDIGDNEAERDSIKVHRVPEPTVSSTQSPVTVSLTGSETIELVYPDGARDAETLMIDPITNDIYVVSKRESRSRLYRAAYPQSTSGVNTMDFVAELPWGWATGGDISPDGDEILVRGYYNASLWPRPAGSDVRDAFGGSGMGVPILWEPQGEAICFDAAGIGYYTTSEQLHQPIYYFERVLWPGDANMDGFVNEGDALLLAANWLKDSTATWGDGDFNDDKAVNDADATILAANWQGTASVPEPTTLSLLAAMATLLFWRRKR